MNWKERIAHYDHSRKKILDGGINCIPCPFPRFKSVFPGIQQAKYYGVTGAQKSGKTQLALYLFCLYPLWYAYNNPDKLKIKILYFSLEMSTESLWDRIISWWLYVKSNKRHRLSTTELNSLNAEYPLNDQIIHDLDSTYYANFLDFIQENLIINQYIRNPVGIYKECINISNQNGSLTYKNVDWMDYESGEIIQKKVIDKYIPNDPNLYLICITDHLGLMLVEKSFGGDKGSLYSTIGKFSSNDCVYLRNVYGWTMVNVQQQSSEKEGNESFKLGRMTPTSDGLSDNKSTAKDMDTLLGIYNPHKYDIKTYKGYDITKFRKNIRFMEIIENREGEGNETCPLYFDGAVNYFEELPKSNTQELKVIEQKYNIQ